MSRLQSSLDVKLCNCAGCGRELLGESQLRKTTAYVPAKYRWHPAVTARINGRPMCGWCLNGTWFDEVNKENDRACNA